MLLKRNKIGSFCPSCFGTRFCPSSSFDGFGCEDTHVHLLYWQQAHKRDTGHKNMTRRWQTCFLWVHSVSSEWSYFSVPLFSESVWSGVTTVILYTQYAESMGVMNVWFLLCVCVCVGLVYTVHATIKELIQMKNIWRSFTV